MINNCTYVHGYTVLVQAGGQITRQLRPTENMTLCYRSLESLAVTTTSYLLLQLARKPRLCPTRLKILPRGGPTEGHHQGCLRGSKVRRDQPGCRFQLKLPLHCRKYELYEYHDGYRQISLKNTSSKLKLFCGWLLGHIFPSPANSTSQKESVLVVSSPDPMLSGRPIGIPDQLRGL